MIRAEIEANNQKTKELADEEGWKVAQNVATGVVGLVIWPVSVWNGLERSGPERRGCFAGPAAISNNIGNGTVRAGL